MPIDQTQNPSDSFDELPHDWPRNPLYRKYLERYLTLRSQPPTFRTMLAMNGRGLVVILLLLGFGMWLGSTAGDGRWAYAMGGFGLAILMQTIRLTRATVQYWPLISVITDWDRVQRLHQEALIETGEFPR
jgi:hypothetical protein